MMRAVVPPPTLSVHLTVAAHCPYQGSSFAAQAAPASQVADAVLANPARRIALVAAFAEAFEFERGAGRLLLAAGALDSGPRAAAPAPSPQLGPAAESAATDTPAAERSSARAASPPQPKAAAAAELPRMPRGLAYVRSRLCYDAVATALRMAARVATSGGGTSSPLSFFSIRNPTHVQVVLE